MAWREELVIGKLTVEQPLINKTYILADLPAAALWTGATVFVSDATPPNLATSDGTIWVAASTGVAAA
jgi:hypothetical protein